MKVIFDCDNTMGLPFKEVDDGLTLLYLLGRQDIDLVGVTTTFGNGSISQVYRLTQKLLAQVGRSDIPVYKGAGKRFSGETEAARFLSESVINHPGEISILATGPLGNLRSAADLDAGFFSKAHKIVCMGGRLTPLNLGKRRISELNLSSDPKAAKVVLNSNSPTVLMNAHICFQASLTREEISRLIFWPSRIRGVLLRWLKFLEVFCSVREFYLWDLLPAVYLSYPDLFSEEKVRIGSSIEDLESGLLVIDENSEGREHIMPSRIEDTLQFKNTLMEAWKKVLFN